VENGASCSFLKRKVDMINWIKLDINILDDAKIKIIRSHPNGDSVVLLWIGLLCLAMKSARPGTIEISDGLPYTVDDLSNLYNIEKKTVEMGLALFCKYRMIELFEGGSIEVINFSKHQSLDKIEFIREQNRARQRRHRKSKLLAITSGNCVYCGSEDNLEIDHIIPISHGGKGTDDNLVSACRDCNTSKNNHNILHFLNYILVDKADHKSINKNQNLMRIIHYNFDLLRYVTHYPVTVTPTDVDVDVDKDKDPPSPRKRGNIGASGFFETFWNSYPKKKAKPDAIKAFAKLKPDQTLLYAIIHAIDKARESEDWQRENGRYIPHPATWLNGQRWKDEIEVQEGSIDAWARKKQAELEAVKNGTV
jgi:predicted phage replisome organizer